MASDAGPGEGPAPQGCSENLVGLASGLVVGESLRPPTEQSPESCSAGAEAQAPAAGKEREETTSQELAVFWVVELQEIEVLELREEAVVGEEVVVVEDIMEVVEVVAEEEVQEQEQETERKSLGEWQEEWGQAQPGYDATEARTSLEALEVLQLELSTVNARANRALCRLKRKLTQRLKPHLDRRSNIIKGVPGFWILNHPQMSAIISDQDVDMLNYMINLEVEEFNHPKNSCKIKFFFGSNPYFQNEMIIKEYDITITGYWETHSTPIQWFHNFEHQAYNYSHHHNNLKQVNVNLNLFSHHNFAVSNRIAEIICEDLWLNPLQYYPRKEESRRGNREADRKCFPFDLQAIEH